MSDSTQRFSSRVADYVRYRPDYPESVVEKLIDELRLDANSGIADIGAGTGIFTRRLLARGLCVAAVEPNDAMRAAADVDLAQFPGYNSVAATAENTGLAERSLDLITAAQAFHWFNNEKTRGEFVRILKPAGRLALIWNKRRLEQSFQQEYHDLLTLHVPDYARLNHTNLDDEDIAGFFAAGQMRLYRFDNRQQLDLAGLFGRLQSASYCPAEDSPQYHALSDALGDLFERENRDGIIEFEYDTRLYLGPIRR